MPETGAPQAIEACQGRRALGKRETRRRATPQIRKRPMKTHRLILPALLPAILLLFQTNQAAHAGSATWTLNPTSGDWNTAANWMPDTVPNGSGDTASFAASNNPNLALSAAVT